MSGGLPSLSSYGGSSGTKYVNHYSTGSDPFKIKVTKSSLAAARARKLAAAEAKKSGGGGILGDILGVGGNLLSDVKDMAYGAIPGTIAAVEHPGTAVHNLVADYKTRYGKILHGDFSDISAHPLSYILDAATLASGGLGAAAKLGEVGKVAEAAATGSRTAKYLNGLSKARETTIGITRGAPKEVKVSLSGNPYVRTRQRALLKIQQAPGISKVPIFGANAKARRTLIGQQRNLEAAARNTQPAYERAIKKLKTATQIHVFDSIARGTSPTDELHFYAHPDIAQHLPPQAKELLGHLEHAGTHNLYDEVVTHLRKAGTGNKDPYLAATSHLSRPAQHVVEALKQHEKLTNQATTLGVKTGKLVAEKTLERRTQHLRIQDEVQGQPIKTPEEYMQAAKNRTGVVPHYVPDKMILGDVIGKGENEGKLYKAGTRHPNPELSIAAHEVQANAASVQRAHDVLKESAQEIPKGEKLPRGWTWLRESDPSKDFIGVNLDRFSKETQPLIESALHAAAKDRGVDPRGMYFESLTQNVPGSGRRAVPKTLAQGMIDRHIRVAGTPSEMLRRTTSLWKGAVLAYRPAFITNNVIGNQALYHLRNGFGPRAIKELGALKRDRPAFEDLFNEHNQTFGHAERFLSESRAAKVGNLAYKVVGAHELILRVATMRHHALKIPEVRSALKALKGGKYDPAKHGGRTMFHEALRRAVEKNPAIKDEIGRVIDDTMGNYRYYNKFEEGLRQLIPFYGWSRHSVRSFERLLADRPAFAQAIAEVGHQGNADQQKDFPGVPEFMRSYLKAHLPGGINAIDTRSLNPMTAAADTVDAAKQAANPSAGNVDQLVGILNPLLVDSVQAMTGTNASTTAPIPKTAFDGLPGGKILGQLLEGLPEARVASHLAGTDAPDTSSARYNFTPTGRAATHKQPMLTHSNAALLSSFLGLPAKQLNLPAAQTFEKKLESVKQPHFHAAKPKAKKKLKIKF